MDPWCWILNGCLNVSIGNAHEAALGAFPEKVPQLRSTGNPLKSQKQQKLVQNRAPKKNQVWIRFGAHSGPREAPKMGSKLSTKFIFFGLRFGTFFFEVLELFGCLLGAFMGLWSLSWEASGPQKP